MTGTIRVGVMSAGDIIKPVTPARFADDPPLRLHDDITQRGKYHISRQTCRPSASSPFTCDKAAGLTLK